MDTAGYGTAPATELEQKIVDALTGVLGCDGIGVDDNFFDLGGESLEGIVVLEELKQSIGIEIPPHVIFENGTAAAIAKYLSAEVHQSNTGILLNSNKTDQIIFSISGINNYRKIARYLDGVFSFYALFSPREIRMPGEAALNYSVEELARDYISLVRDKQPSGPYVLLGHSFAGVLAYEVSRRLRAAGEEVRLLIMLDSRLPERKLAISKLGRLLQASPRLVVSFVWRRFKEAMGWQLSPVQRVSGHEKVEPLRARRDIRNLEAALDFIPKITPYDGNVLLVTSSERLRDFPLESPNCGWARYMPALEVRSVDTDHFKMLTDDPYAHQIAEFLIGSIQRVG
jgi:thioesterase domain-containing protein/acyl carrier protein